MQNKPIDLNNHLFLALEAVNQEGQNAEALRLAVARARAVAAVGTQIVANYKLVLEAQKFLHGEQLPRDQKLPTIIDGSLAQLEVIPGGKV